MASAVNIHWHAHLVSSQDRERIKGHRGCVIWFTGLSGSGKSTVANDVDYKLNAQGIHTYILDGDNIRTGLNGDLGFTAKDREENVRRVGEVAKLMADAGLVVLVPLVSPYRADRYSVRNKIKSLGSRRFIEVYVKTCLEECERRDPKGLYKKARAGEIPNFTGISDPYEPPLSPELSIDSSSNVPIEVLSSEVVGYIQEIIGCGPDGNVVGGGDGRGECGESDAVQPPPPGKA